MFTFWIAPFTLALIIYALILIVRDEYNYFYLSYIIIYSIDILCQIVSAFQPNIRYKLLTLVASILLLFQSIGFVIFYVTTYRALSARQGAFHLLVLIYANYLALLYAVYTRRIYHEAILKQRILLEKSEEEARLRKVDSDAGIDYYIQPIDKKDSLWSIRYL
eukprot:NODE_296_length_10502_cov_0.638374.p3 type:complete len:163 gc:universal NODE_296_length_10502_cov_0.638374:3202-2714(-)